MTSSTSTDEVSSIGDEKSANKERKDADSIVSDRTFSLDKPTLRKTSDVPSIESIASKEDKKRTSLSSDQSKKIVLSPVRKGKSTEENDKRKRSSASRSSEQSAKSLSSKKSIFSIGSKSKKDQLSMSKTSKESESSIRFAKA